MKALVLIIISLMSTVAMAAAKVDIDHDVDDCAAGWMSMDVRISVDGEAFNYDPSCGFAFREFFTTQKGVVCKVEAGMCSSFSPRKRLEVRCADGGHDDIEIKCPPKTDL